MNLKKKVRCTSLKKRCILNSDELNQVIYQVCHAIYKQLD